MIQADDGTLIHVANRGLSNSRVSGNPPRYVQTVPVFEDLLRTFLAGSIAVYRNLEGVPGTPVEAAIALDLFCCGSAHMRLLQE